MKSNVRLSKTELQEIQYLKEGFQDPRISPTTKRIVLQGIKVFWKLVEAKYHIDTTKLKELKKDGTLVLQ